MKVICISGKAQNGKDTTANFLKDVLEDGGYSVLIAHYGDLVKYICQRFFGWNGIKDKAGRSILQKIGTDMIRKHNPHYWVDFICGVLKMFPDEWDFVLIPDTRFPDEFGVCKENGFDTYLLRIERPNFDNGLTDEQKIHISETALDNSVYDSIIYNDGTLAELQKKALKFVLEMTDETSKSSV